MRPHASANPLFQFPYGAPRFANLDFARLELHFLASLIRDTDANLKRVSRPPFRTSAGAALVYTIYGRRVIETLGLKFENAK